MGDALDRLVIKLARQVKVTPYVRKKAGKIVAVEGYIRKGLPGMPEVPAPGNGKKGAPVPGKPVPERQVGPGAARLLKTPTRGKGTKDDPIVTGDVLEAAKALSEDKYVRLTSKRQVSTLIDRLAEIVNDAKAKGEDAPNYNLCRVTVKNTNLFCAESKEIPRIEMPQFSGFPTPGTESDKFPKDADGKVDLSAEFAKYITENDVTGDGVPEVVDDEEMPAAMLKATQNELGGAAVAKIAKSMEKNGIDPDQAWLWTSNDDYVIDGHHRWAAMVAVGINRGEDVKVPVHRVNMDIITILAVAKEWTAKMGIKQKSLAEAK